MHYTVRLKFSLYENYWWLLCMAFAIATGILISREEQVTTVVTTLGALLSVAYFLQKQKLEEMRLFREIFKECNARYDAMNDELAEIGMLPPKSLSTMQIRRVIDYLNLCGEEYLYYKRGYIEPSVWQAWENGMKNVVLAPSINDVWQKEKGNGSYYNLPL